MTVKKYEIFEEYFKVQVEGNPFDVEFFVQIVSPTGRSIKVDGFYDGEEGFAFRFMPEEWGEYTYMTRSPVSTLNGMKGKFTCIENEEEIHGPVRVQDQYWFAHEDGKAYFEAGTTAYGWIHQEAELREKTLETLSHGYFNKLRMCVFPKWYEYNHREPQLYPFEGNVKEGFNYDRPNVKFFKHLDSCVEKLKKLNIQADIILFHPYEVDHWHFNYMTKEQDERYLRYVVARLSAFHNVWWSMANEYDLITTGYKKKRTAWKHLIQFVADHDPYNHLLSIHQMNKMYDHRDKNITHCSIQRTEMFLTAEYTDTWREKYKKPVVIDEGVYEGDLNAWWGGITAQELVRRFWEATARGGYMGHGESYYGENIWWSHGGTLVGKSQSRIAFLKNIMEKCPHIQFSCESGTNNIARAIDKTYSQLIYFGFYQPRQYEVRLIGTGKYDIYVIDTWNMTVEKLENSHMKTVRVDLPRKPYMAILCISVEEDNGVAAFTRDSIFEEMKFTSGGRKILSFFKIIVPQYYSGMLTMTINQCNAQSGGMLDGWIGDFILKLANKK